MKREIRKSFTFAEMRMADFADATTISRGLRKMLARNVRLKRRVSTKSGLFPTHTFIFRKVLKYIILILFHELL